MTDHTERDIVIEDHFRRNSSRLVKNLSVKCKGWFNAEDSVHNAYERALRYWDSYEPDMGFDKWFEAVLRNAVSATSTRSEIPCLVPETEKQVRRIVEDFKAEVTARFGEPDTDE